MPFSGRAHDGACIALTTDFGSDDPYVGVVKGVIAGINASACIVDLCHGIEPQSIAQGGFLLANSYHFFPKGSIHVAVVDPDVGTERRIVLLSTNDYYFIAPDNGLLSYVIKDLCVQEGHSYSVDHSGTLLLPSNVVGYQVENTRYQLPSLSSTFHARDIMGPVAAHLSTGIAPYKFGAQTDHIVGLELNDVKSEDKVIMGRVVHIDKFGNLITDIPQEILPSGLFTTKIKGVTIDQLSSSYASGEGLIAVIGSFNTLEVAYYRGNAAKILGVTIGEQICVTRIV